jgi:hypothetical protein
MHRPSVIDVMLMCCRYHVASSRFHTRMPANGTDDAVHAKQRLASAMRAGSGSRAVIDDEHWNR